VLDFSTVPLQQNSLSQLRVRKIFFRSFVAKLPKRQQLFKDVFFVLIHFAFGEKQKNISHRKKILFPKEKIYFPKKTLSSKKKNLIFEPGFPQLSTTKMSPI
jgi:hypothetical protein